MDNVEMAQESLEHAHGGHEHAPAPRSTRFAAVLVAVIAATAVVVEMDGSDKQTAYLAHDVAASDLWSQYQGKSVRRTVMLDVADVLDAEAALLPEPAPPGKAERIARMAAADRTAAAQLADDPQHEGMRQISARAQAEEEAREHALHLHEGLERSVRGLQIAIVLVGLFMVTRLFFLLYLGGALAATAFVYGVLAGFGLA